MQAIRYVAVGLLGAVIGGYVVARVTGSLPKAMSRLMSQMMEGMAPEQRDHCREMMARFRANGHKSEPVDATTTQASTAV